MWLWFITGMYHVSSALWNHFLRPDPSWCVMGRILHHALRIDAIAASKLKTPSRNSLEFARQLGPIVDSFWPGWGRGWLYCISDVEALPFLILAAFVLRGAAGYWCVCVCNTGFLPPFPSYWAISVLMFYHLKTILLEVENDPLERLNPSSKAPFSSPCVPLNMNISFRFHTWFGFASNSLTAHTRL